MLRSYRSIVAALIGCLILVGNAQPISNSARRDTATAQSNQEATQHSDIASGISRIGNQLEAQAAKADPYEKERNDREIRDLQAQENSAYWAGAMFWATLGALALSVVGVGLVYITFRETRKAAESSQKTLNAYIARERGILAINRLQFSFTQKDFFEIGGQNLGAAPCHLRNLKWSYVNKNVWPTKLPWSIFQNGVAPGQGQASASVKDANAVKLGKYLAVEIEYETVLNGPFYSYQFFRVPETDMSPGDVCAVEGMPRNT